MKKATYLISGIISLNINDISYQSATTSTTWSTIKLNLTLPNPTGGYVYFVYIYVLVQTIYLCSGTLVPWYIVISVTLICYCWLLQHVRTNKASLQSLSVSSLLVLHHQLLRVDQQQHIEIQTMATRISNFAKTSPM